MQRANNYLRHDITSIMADVECLLPSHFGATIPIVVQRFT